MTGTLKLSGSSGGHFSPEGAALDLHGLNSSIRGLAPGTPGYGHLHMYAEHNLYLGTRNTDEIAIGIGNDPTHPTDAPIYIHNTNKTVSLSGSTVQVTGSTILSGSVNFAGYQAAATSLTASVNAAIVGCTATGITITLENPASLGIGRILVIKDETGAAGLTPITISASVGTIDGETTQDLDENHEAVSIYSNGSNWFIY